MKIKVINNSKFDLPEYATSGSAGMDLRANIDVSIDIPPFERRIIPTGIHIQLPEGYEAQARPRSGLALKNGVEAFFGTIDSDYTDEIKVILRNYSKELFTVRPGDRIAQLVISKFETADWEEVEKLEKTSRQGGFGSSGIN